MDTALLMFAEGGFARTTVKDIATSAGISNGLMYHYFPSKEKLLEAAIEKHSFLPHLRVILKGTEEPCREVLKKIAARFSDILKQENNSIRILLQEGHSNAEVKKVWDSLSSEGSLILQQYLSSRIAAGELKPHNTEVTARCLFSILFMFSFTRDIFKSSNLSDSQFIEESIDSILNGIQKNNNHD
ncbi:MAG: TetR/AcrR family transcriptional regulator [Dehalococcoidales bacterium]|nr:TetR/AcrR family transcriptional regulator [Dehalococcoidales bacterium]